MRGSYVFTEAKSLWKQRRVIRLQLRIFAYFLLKDNKYYVNIYLTWSVIIDVKLEVNS